MRLPSKSRAHWFRLQVETRASISDAISAVLFVLAAVAADLGPGVMGR